MIYMKIEGIDGNVTSSGHEKWIELGSLQWGISRMTNMSAGAGHERETSAPQMTEFSVTKQMDEASPKIFQEACSGQAKKVQIHLVRTANDKLQTYMEYELDNCLVSAYSVSSGGDAPTEALAFAYTKVTMKFTHWDKSNKPGTPIAASYDLETAKKG